MKNLFLSIIAVVSLAFGAQAFAQERPTIKVGDTRVYELKNPRGLLLDTFNVVVTEVTASGGHTIKRTSGAKGEEIVSFSPNLGQDTDVRGNKGDGNLYSFPMTKGMAPWVSKSYWLSDQGGVGYDEITYTVEGEEDITVPAGKFRVTKVVGKGNWRLGQWGNTIEVVIYYSPVVKSHVRIERGRRMSSGFLETTVLDLASYKHAD